MSYLQEKLNSDPINFTPAEQEQIIQEHYNSIATLVTAFANRTTGKRGLIVNGPNGGGKTEVVKHTLDLSNAEYHIINGSMTAPQLYCRRLYDTQH